MYLAATTLYREKINVESPHKSHNRCTIRTILTRVSVSIPPQRIKAPLFTHTSGVGLNIVVHIPVIRLYYRAKLHRHAFRARRCRLVAGELAEKQERRGGW